MTSTPAPLREYAARVRLARPSDADALIALHDLVWRETYAHLMPESALADHAGYNARRWPQRLTDATGPRHWVAERDGELVGFAWAVDAGLGEGEEGPPYTRELVALYLRRSDHGRGLGRALLDAAVADAPCFCWVAAENLGARRFYAAAGFVPDGARRTIETWGGLEIIRMARVAGGAAPR